MGYWQIFLTIYLLLQFVVGMTRQVKISRLEGQTESELQGSIVGICIKFVIIFIALYMGGFYNT